MIELLCTRCNQIFLEGQTHTCSTKYDMKLCDFCKMHYSLSAGHSCVGSTKTVDHPPHYGGKDNPYEAIKVIEAWGLGFCLGNVVKYLSRAGKKGDKLEDLKKAQWYLNREIEFLQKERTV